MSHYYDPSTMVPCPGCVRKGEPKPFMVRPGHQCNFCAEIEEGIGHGMPR